MALRQNKKEQIVTSRRAEDIVVRRSRQKNVIPFDPRKIDEFYCNHCSYRVAIWCLLKREGYRYNISHLSKCPGAEESESFE